MGSDGSKKPTEDEKTPPKQPEDKAPEPNGDPKPLEPGDYPLPNGDSRNA
jgi:hypothetical protein